MPRFINGVFCVITLFMCTYTPAPCQELLGHAILAKAGGDSIIVWDASPVVASVVRDNLSDTDANALIERDALGVAVRMSALLNHGVRSITVRIGYNKTGDVSPVYGGATFAGIEHYATLALSVGDLKKFIASKQRVTDAGIPRFAKFTVLGELPPRQSFAH